MGCGKSKPTGSVHDPLRPSCIGSVARGWDEHLKEQGAGMQVSAITGNWEIARDSVEASFNTQMGEGAFGFVYMCEAKVGEDGARQPVVVKELHDHGDAPQPVVLDFMKEIQFMKEIKNANVLQMLGACTMDKPKLIIYEYPSRGTLKEFLLAEDSASLLSPTQRLQMSMDVSLGAKYLAELRVVHRDLV